MKDWIPLLQTLVWPIFLIGIYFTVKRRHPEILNSVKKRILHGGEISIGPSGISIGSAPALEEIAPNESKLAEILEGAALNDELEQRKNIDHLRESLYLVHSAEFYRTAGASYDRRDVYTIKVQLFSVSESLLDKIDKVVYVKHPSFKRRREEISDRSSNFELVERLWGQFNLHAEVYFRDLTQPVILSRYLNF